MFVLGSRRVAGLIKFDRLVARLTDYLSAHPVVFKFG